MGQTEHKYEVYAYPWYIIARLYDDLCDVAKRVEFTDDKLSIVAYKVGGNNIRIDIKKRDLSASV